MVGGILGIRYVYKQYQAKVASQAVEVKVIEELQGQAQKMKLAAETEHPSSSQTDILKSLPQTKSSLVADGASEIIEVKPSPSATTPLSQSNHVMIEEASAKETVGDKDNIAIESSSPGSESCSSK